MPPRTGPVHVAKIERKYRGTVYRSFLLRRTYRDGPRVRHETLGNISHLPEPLIDLIRRGLRGETFVPAGETFEILRARPHGHVAATLGTLRHLELEGLLASRRSRERDLVVAMIAARILEPRSKLATARSLDPQMLHSTLGECLEVAGAGEDELYAAMDWLLERQGRIEAGLARRHLAEGGLVLCDVSTTWFEGRHCPLARLVARGEGPPGKLKILFGLLTNSEGCPVAVQVFEGNLGDPKTLAPQLAKLRERFGLKRFVMVGDRGLLTEARVKKELQGVEGLQWITALRAPSIRALVEQGALQLSLFDERDLGEIHSPDYPGERLVVCRNPLLAEERARKRTELLAATQRELEKIVQATRRSRRALRGIKNIGLRVGKVLGRFKMGKHFKLHIRWDSFRYERREENIAAEAALDGFYVLRTTVPRPDLSSEEVVRTYKRLSQVERAFRSLKTVDLKVRPIRHWDADRVRAHVFLCMLAYYVEWHMRRALAPLLFDDEDPAAGQARRASVVAPARRSLGAERKALLKRTEEGLPVQSFQDLLLDLATLTKNRVRPRGLEAVTFDMLPTPTEVQARAFELLKVSPAM